jgi:xanthine dehydrogenase YagS FAD-binding subunit
MRPFSYSRAASAATAIAAVSGRHDARFIAGGTNIIDLMKDDVERPGLLVDINALPYANVAVHGGADGSGAFKGLRIGALARMSDVADHPEVKRLAPAISEALLLSASAQLRNAASIGGNVMQRTRCAYFRDVAGACNKRTPGEGCAALGGENRLHAVLGGSDHCICTHASDLSVALVALDASLRIRDAKGERSVPLAEFYRLPGNTPQHETALLPGELIVAVDVPNSAAAMRSQYLKIRDRSSYEFALVSVAAGLEVSEGLVHDARLALGGVAPIPWRARAAEKALIGSAPSAEAFAGAARLALEGARGHGQNDFKIELARRAVVRALSEVSA